MIKGLTKEQCNRLAADISLLYGTADLLNNNICSNCYVWQPPKICKTEQELCNLQAETKLAIQKFRALPPEQHTEHFDVILAAINENDPNDRVWEEYRRQLAEFRRTAGTPKATCDSAFAKYIDTAKADPEKLLCSMHALIDEINNQRYITSVIAQAFFKGYLRFMPSLKDGQQEFPNWKQMKDTPQAEKEVNKLHRVNFGDVEPQQII